MADPRPGPPPLPAPDDPATVDEGVAGGVMAGGTVGRRSFFRQLAGELIQTAGSLSGVATIAQGAVAGATAAASELGLEDAARAPVASASTVRVASVVATPDAPIVPWTWDGDRLLLLDQRRLPGAGPAFPVTSAASAARAISERVVSGPAAAAVAAWGLVFAAESAAVRVAAAGPLLRGARASLPAADAGSSVLRRTLAALSDAPSRSDAAAIAERFGTEHAALAARLTTWLRGAGIEAPLLHGESGPLWGAGSGVGVDAIAAATDAGTTIWVSEGRPWLTGARITAWELARHGRPATVVPDAATASLLLTRRTDALLMVAERAARDGTLALPLGALGLAVVAARAGVPVVVALPAWAVDLDARDAADLAEPPIPAAALSRAAGSAITPPGTSVHAPRLDHVPADLVTHRIDQGAPTP